MIFHKRQENANNGNGQQVGYPADNYPMEGMNQGYPIQQTNPIQQTSMPPQGYASYPGGQGMQGYPQAQGYQSPQAQGYQTPQVTGGQPPVNPYQVPGQTPYIGQGSFAQNAYVQPDNIMPQAGYSGNGQTPVYPQQSGSTGFGNSYSQPMNPVPGGSYIPQTPYSKGYTSPGYQAPTGYYNQGYNAYGQMGRSQQPQMPFQQEPNGQIPINGGGYVPAPVPVRRRPFEMNATHILIISAALLALFVTGMFIPGLGILKWVFLVLAGGMIALLWLKPIVANNMRLCFSIVFALLAAVTIIGLVSPGSSGNNRTSGSNASNRTGTETVRTGSDEAGTAQKTSAENTASGVNLIPEGIITNTPEPTEDNILKERVKSFFYFWSVNRTDDMLALCSPTWASKSEDAKKELFHLLRNRTPIDYEVENVSGTQYDESRTAIMVVTINKNDGKDPVKYRLNVLMIKENDGKWYVDPQSLQSYDVADTPDPSITPTPGPTDPPTFTSSTTLYYNTKGGKYYHLDPNCKRIDVQYLPLKGKFTYAELNNPEYRNLEPCNICGAPAREE